MQTDIRTKKEIFDVLHKNSSRLRALGIKRIGLFGSFVSGEQKSDSDIDLLVIKGGKFNRRRLTTAIYRHLRGKQAPVDVVVVTPDEMERYGDSPYLVIYPALREGKVVHVV